MSCCTPTTERDAGFRARTFEHCTTAARPDSVAIPGGTGLLGTAHSHIRSDGEGPLRQVSVAPLSMSRGAITNADFAAFVDATGYITEAEHFGWSFVFWSQVDERVGPTQGVPGTPWWRRVDGACWRHLTGPDCLLSTTLVEHPVVHISWNDARAYCSWIGGRLPTESEWEHAARGGLGDVRFPWGDAEPDDDGHCPCNIWQGQFPRDNTLQDGFATTAPVISFEPNGFGLYNLVGNVWEWTEDAYSIPARHVGTRHQAARLTDNKLAKGGSFLCHKSYCYRYRIAARIGNSSDSATTHMGFRVVWDTLS